MLLIASEVAELLQLRESTVKDYARRGLIPSVKIGRHLRFVRDDVDRYIESLRGSAAEGHPEQLGVL